MTIRRTVTALALVAALLLAAGAAIAASAQASEDQAAAQQPRENAAQLDGAKVYAWNCGSCHSERRPNERTDREWEVITTHMRVRANLTAEQSAAVLDYLRENN